ncbi:putative bifunctional diguanylate cyclase/phosphodiesterase [Shewanella atlantica]|nr:EAL domain-containing protein [Shewanella atlantica]
MSAIPLNQALSRLEALFNELSLSEAECELDDVLKPLAQIIQCESIFILCIPMGAEQVRLSHVSHIDTPSSFTSRAFTTNLDERRCDGRKPEGKRDKQERVGCTNDEILSSGPGSGACFSMAELDTTKIETTLNYSRYFNYFIRKNIKFIMSDIEQMPGSFDVEKAMMSSLYIRNLILLPSINYLGHRYIFGAINSLVDGHWAADASELLSMACSFIVMRKSRDYMIAKSRGAECCNHELLDRLPLACVQVNGNNKLNQYNHAAQKLLGNREWLSLTSLVHDDEKFILLDTIQLVRDGLLEQAWCELPVMCVDNSFNWLKLSFSLVPNGADTLLLVAEDVSDRHKLADELSFQTNFDNLTGLPNRAYFESYYSCGRNSDERAPAFVAFLNLDQFQVINNISGHKAGDRLLCQIALRLKQLVRKGDIVARLGGDEFGILMHAIDSDVASRIAERICEQLSHHEFVWDNRKHSVSVSMGLAAFNGEDEEISAVLSRADAACRVVKEKGRNSWHMYSPTDPHMDRLYSDMNASVDVVGALALDRFELYFQPIEPLLEDDNGLHMEILLRMLTEQGEIVSPAVFLPAAERYSLASRVDRWVVDHLLYWGGTHLKVWNELSMVSVNLSATSLGDVEFMNWLEMRLMGEPELVSKLCFEITETAAVSQLDLATALIDVIKPLGCKLALDDFGSGFSSFAYLKLLDVDFVKIDGQFVRHLCENRSDQAIVTAICQLGRDMEFEIIAEFVESIEIGRRLKRLGVDFAQGYAIAKPKKLNTLVSGKGLHWLTDTLTQKTT